MNSPVVLIQGASRGIGLQFCKHFLARNSALVLATCRNPNNSLELQELKSKFSSRLAIYTLNVHNQDQIQEASKQIQENHGKKLDLLVNCSGILHPSGKGETSLREVTYDGVASTFFTNSLGPLLMAKYFSPLLLNGSSVFGSQSGGQFCGVIANISARVGSISDNSLGGWYSYRMSKAALNMATKTLSVELGRSRKKVVCVSLHPGTVDTDLSRRYHKNVDPAKIFTPEYSVQCMIRTIEELSLDDTGKFFAWDGQEIPY